MNENWNCQLWMFVAAKARLLGMIFATLAAMCMPSAPQTVVTGEIAGSVTDPAGAGVPKATVKAKSDASGETRTVTTNADGQFHIALLPPGSYTLSASASGFSTTEVRETVQLAQATTANIQLSLQSVSQTVEVTEQVPLLQTENANIATTFSTTQLQNLPIPGSDMAAIAYTTPGLTLSTGGGYGAFTAFGLPATSNSFAINGSDYMDPYLNLNNSGASNLSLGANEIQETAIIVDGYTGQYGRQSGAQINWVTKSGTNAFHGNGIWNWNGTKLNANDFFNNANATARPHAVSNQWATSFGGPIKKDKVFFFVDYEGLRYVLPSSSPIYIPTTDFAAHVLNNLQTSAPAAIPFYTKAFNIWSGASGAGRAVPVTASVDPALGCGDFTGGGFGTALPCARQFQSSVNNLNTEWLLNERADFNITDRDRLYVRGSTDQGVQATGTDAINSAFNANSVQPQWSVQLGYTRVVTPNAVNELLLSGFYYSALFGPPNLAAALAVFPTTFAFNDGLYSPLGGGANPNGVANSLSNYPSGRKVGQWQIVDDFAYTRGRHEFKFGVNFRRDDVGDYAYGPQTSGLLTFNSMTDFVNGTLTNGSLYTQSFARLGAEHVGFYSASFYVQDQWRIRPNLTVTLALPLFRAQNPSCGRDCYSRLTGTFEELTHDPTVPYNSIIHTGLSSTFRNIDAIVVQPRVGIAYSVNSKTVIRAGGGLFADQFQGNLASRFFLNTPNVAAFTATSGIVAPGVPGGVFDNVAASNAAFQNGFANGATVAQLRAAVPGFSLPTLYTVTNNFHIPRYAEWNFEIQRELTQRITLSVNYVGNHGWNEYNQDAYENAWNAAGFGGLPTAVPDARFGEIMQLSNQGYSNYDGLNTTVRWRWSSVVGQVNYTYGHALDTCSNNCTGRFNLYASPSLRYQLNPYQVAYGNSDYDVRHSFSANYVWTIPTRFQNQFMKRALGGWAIAGTFLAKSGYPFTVINSSLRSKYVQNSSGLPNPSATIAIPATWLGGPSTCSTPNVTCFPKSDFLTTAKQTDFGNLARNSFRSPGFFDTDLNVTKNVASTEKFKVILGAAFYNILNHANFDLPFSNLASGVFGQILETAPLYSSAYGSFQGSAVSGRVIVTNLKFEF